MDTNKANDKNRARGLFSFIKGELALRKQDRLSLVLDILIFCLSFFFAKRHIAFGTYPLGISLVGVLNRRVLIAALGAIIGAVSLGSGGIIYALMIPLVVILRLVLSRGGKDGNGVFSEPYVIRVFSVAISAALIALYELLRAGPTLNATLFACVGLLLSVGISISLFGAFTSDITYKDILYSSPLAIKRGGELLPGPIFYQASMLLLILLSTLSLDGYSFFGITLSYIFLSAVTLFVAVRFGVARGMLVGFVGGLVLGGVASVGFALAGLVSALLFHIGAGYAVVGSALALGAWCGYVGGVSGFLSAFPEFAITATLMLPFIRKCSHSVESAPADEAQTKSPTLSLLLEEIKKKSRVDIAERIEELSTSLRRFSSDEGVLEFSEYRNIILAATCEMKPTPCEEKIDALASKFYKGDKLTAADIVRVLGEGSESVASVILRLSSEYERECFMSARQTGLVGEYERLIKLLKESEGHGCSSVKEDKELSKIISEVLHRLGVVYNSALVVGEYEKHIIIITEENGYNALCDKELHLAIKNRLGRALLNVECGKSYGVATLVAKIAPLYTIEYGIQTFSGDGSGISGDTARVAIIGDSIYSVLSDGVGRGAGASHISTFVTDYLMSSLTPNAQSTIDAVTALCAILRSGRTEASATADVMSLNLYTGKGYFLKCGAISSYIKRGSEVLEINGGGAPVGLVGAPIAESVEIELGYEDVVVMASDGVIADADAAYLTEYMKNPITASAESYATSLINLARDRGRCEDDMTVIVIKILPYSETT